MNARQIRIAAGFHDRVHCPIRVRWPDSDFPTAVDFDGILVPAQADGEELVFIAPPLAAGSAITGTLARRAAADVSGVRVEDTGSTVRVSLSESELTTYHYAGVPARPYFWPMVGPDGTRVTRAYPMEQAIAGETQDHPHHRSLYVAFGDVNGTDNWSEMPGHGYTVHLSVDELVSGPVFGRFATSSDWTDASRNKLLTQNLRVTTWQASDSLRLMDFDVELEASACDLRFGDTKEGGILSVRVASSMDVPRGGRIDNAYGGVGEAETWGKAANWCDYSGHVDGTHVGICIMDHPQSFRYPSYWHVRDYGLMTANPFGLGDFTRGLKNGTHLVPQGASIQFRYRLALHRGDAAAAGMRDHYINFVSPPRVEVL